jgi:predicted GIY-YIG superfamily endonuclease
MRTINENLQSNGYPQNIIETTRERRVTQEDDDNNKPTTVCLPYVKNVSEKIQKICIPYNIRVVFQSRSTLRSYISHTKPSTEITNIKNCVYSIHCTCGFFYLGETCRPLKVRVEEHRKAVCKGETSKSGIADHVWREKGKHLPLWSEVEIIDREERWKVRKLKESAHMLGKNNCLSNPSIEMDSIWEPLIMKDRRQ